MRSAIIGGTGVYNMVEGDYTEHIEITPYGEARVYLGRGENDDLVFLPRHGAAHTIPPHMINYRANFKALKQLGVARIMAVFAVGSISNDVLPGSLVLLHDFIDFSSGRPLTYYDGGDNGLIHTEVNRAYCDNLRGNLLALAPKFRLSMAEEGIYACFNGPRFETPAEIRMMGQLGADVVGMTGVPEVVLARELEMHYAAVAQSVNWAAGIRQKIEILREGIDDTRAKLLNLFVAALRKPFENSCECQDSMITIHPPKS